jgi:hypothetical protein
VLPACRKVTWTLSVHASRRIVRCSVPRQQPGQLLQRRWSGSRSCSHTSRYDGWLSLLLVLYASYSMTGYRIESLSTTQSALILVLASVCAAIQTVFLHASSCSLRCNTTIGRPSQGQRRQLVSTLPALLLLISVLWPLLLLMTPSPPLAGYHQSTCQGNQGVCSRGRAQER